MARINRSERSWSIVKSLAFESKRLMVQVTPTEEYALLFLYQEEEWRHLNSVNASFSTLSGEACWNFFMNLTEPEAGLFHERAACGGDPLDVLLGPGQKLRLIIVPWKPGRRN